MSDLKLKLEKLTLQRKLLKELRFGFVYSNHADEEQANSITERLKKLDVEIREAREAYDRERQKELGEIPPGSQECEGHVSADENRPTHL